MHILRHTPEFKPYEVLVAEEVIDSYLGDPGSSGFYTLVAEADSTVAGYICYGPTPLTEGTWDIYWMAVAPDKQKQGIGSSLIGMAEDEIRKKQGRLAVIETSSIPSYANTRHFYSRHGYETIASLPDFYSIGDDKVILLKRLR
ncbi:MAG: GNAT family N-acetyltransferase [Chloroflexi bacterium]|nr:GNAT family N-acetyltransferase [Chloroflexota bacterium]